MPTTHTPLILASSSAIRQQMLKAVGLEFSVVPSGVEEESIKQEMQGEPCEALALALAKAKTLSVAKHYPDALTIGADQLCVMGASSGKSRECRGEALSGMRNVVGHTNAKGCTMPVALLPNESSASGALEDSTPLQGGSAYTVLNKPHTVEKAQEQLALLSGEAHQQISAVSVARGEEVLWEHCDIATLTMRQLSDNEIAAYIAADKPLHSCGAYKFEGFGRHLFALVEGSSDTIKGLPLVPLLAELHRRGAITLA